MKRKGWFGVGGAAMDMVYKTGIWCGRSGVGGEWRWRSSGFADSDRAVSPNGILSFVLFHLTQLGGLHLAQHWATAIRLGLVLLINNIYFIGQ